jgi:hypothetical protein
VRGEGSLGDEGTDISGEGQLDALLHLAEQACVPLEGISSKMENFLSSACAIVTAFDKSQTIATKKIQILVVGAIPCSCSKNNSNKGLERERGQEREARREREVKKAIPARDSKQDDA